MGNTQLFSLKSNNISFYCIVHLTCKYEIRWLFREEKTTYVSVIVSELLNGKMYPGVFGHARDLEARVLYFGALFTCPHTCSL